MVWLSYVRSKLIVQHGQKGNICEELEDFMTLEMMYWCHAHVSIASGKIIQTQLNHKRYLLVCLLHKFSQLKQELESHCIQIIQLLQWLKVSLYLTQYLLAGPGWQEWTLFCQQLDTWRWRYRSEFVHLWAKGDDTAAISAARLLLGPRGVYWVFGVKK